MKKTILNRSFCLCVLLLVALCSYGQTEKKVQVFRNGEVIQEYLVSEIDYIEVNDVIPVPENLVASVSANQITITWNAVAGATYSIYRSADNINFSVLASGLTETSYTDSKPLQGTNYYKVKAVVNGTESNYTASAAATMTTSEMNSGIYLGIVGFNQEMYRYPVLQLTENSVDGFRNFVNNLTMKNGTLLYYSVDQALNALQSTELPADLSTAAIVTFTDGLDQGSMMMDDIPYDDDDSYLEGLNNRIHHETVSGLTVKAFSIGIRGKDVSDINMFSKNLEKLASSSDNAFEVSSMSEVNANFKKIAETLSMSNYVQTINLTMPGVSNGTVVRFTFDNVASADKSNLYIEGTFNLKARSLENVKYVGLTSTSGETIRGTVDGIFVNFTFENVHTDSNVLVKSEFTDEWTYIASNSSWQINSEFDKTENSDIVTERSSAVVMLVLDCSSSLAGDFVKAQDNARDFINTLYQAVGGTEEGGGDQETTIYSTAPLDLSIAIWKDGKRYYLTEEQYKSANLSNATVEGLTVLSNMGNFIISPENMTAYVHGDYAITYYSDILPDKNQATVISARYLDINNALSSLGWSRFSTESGAYYMTKTQYSGRFNYQIYLYSYRGGSLATNYTSGSIRGVKAIGDDAIVWKDSRDLTLAVQKDGKRYFLTDPNEDLSQYDEVEGVAVVMGENKFIIRLHDEQSGTVNKTTAMAMYEDILPDKTQAEIISMKFADVNTALSKFNGDSFSIRSDDRYMTKTPYNSNYNYQIYLYSYAGGSLAESSSTYGYIRGVKAFQDE